MLHAEHTHRGQNGLYGGGVRNVDPGVVGQQVLVNDHALHVSQLILKLQVKGVL